ncbi:hypothetical protein [Pseudonocardia sp. HH130630-07]|uniref:hypothetical protein n=1 Tax=Pseudonocardia sp. HH130630-07 TaxID=1690815 RepID=UPI001E54B3B3|nr:hypothetical protein [Pseudonocardia sp. HH130630-07]
MSQPALIPVEDLFAPPAHATTSISPDGTRLAFLAPWKDRTNVWVQDLHGPDDTRPEPRCVSAEDTCTVLRYLWTSDPRWLLYLRGRRGHEDRHLLRIDLDDPDAAVVDLTPGDGVRVLDACAAPGRPGRADVWLAARTPGGADLHELDVATGRLTVLAESDRPGMSWIRTGDGRLFATTPTADGDLEIAARDPRTGELQTVLTRPGADHPLGVLPIEPTPDGAGLWLGARGHSDLNRLTRVDLGTGTETPVEGFDALEIDAERRAGTDGSSALIRDHEGELLGIRYLGDRRVVHPVHPRFADVLDRIEALSDGDLDDVSSDRTGRYWVASFAHDRDPGVTWLYDHTTGAAELLFRSHPQLDPDALAPMRPVTIIARDGLALPTLVTLPVGVEPAGLPLVLLVHDGP